MARQDVFIHYDDPRVEKERADMEAQYLCDCAEYEEYKRLNDALKPCPFCGSKGEMYITRFGKRRYYTSRCSNSGCVARNSNKLKDSQEAVRRWNRRVSK